MNLTSRYRRRAQMLLAVPLIFVASQIASGDDWPQWMGPNRDGQYRETGLVEKIPEGGLPVKWRVPVSYGYSGPAVADGKVFVTDYIIESGTSKNNPGGRDKLQGTERLLCFDANTGQTLWKVEYQRPYNLSYAKGPRATPTIDGKNVYALGAEGDLLCVDINDGNTIWRKQLAEEYSSQPPIWGHSAHPLVHKDLVICLAGGEGSVVVALDKRTAHAGSHFWISGTQIRAPASTGPRPHLSGKSRSHHPSPSRHSNRR